MRDEVFTLPTSLPTSPSPPPPPAPVLVERSGHGRSSTILDNTNGNNQGNGVIGSNSVPNHSTLSSPRSISPLPLPPPNPELDHSYPGEVQVNFYTDDTFGNQVLPSIQMGYTDKVHDLSSNHFEKTNIPDYMFEGGSPEVFDRLEGFEPVHTMATFDLLTTGRGEAGSCDTLTREDGSELRDVSPATTTSFVNNTPEPQADHRVTFAPAVTTISPEPYNMEEEVPDAVVNLNSSSSNNNDVTSTDNDVSALTLPPVAEIVEGEELNDQQLEPSTITLWGMLNGKGQS